MTHQFTVTASTAAAWVQVAWEDEVSDYWFTAEVDGDTFLRVRDGGIGRKVATVYRRRKGGGRGALSYHPADDFAEIVQEAAELIAAERLATQAFAQRDRERAARETERITVKAAKLRMLMQRHGLPAPDKLTDKGLAALFDDIQDAQV